MTQTAHLELGPVQADGSRPAVVTDHGGLLVQGVIARDTPGESVPAPFTPARPALTHDDIAFLVATAARAPSVHNTQPWKFRVSGNVIELRADTGRQLHQVDPAGRELMMSCGAAVFGLRLGLRKLGYLGAVRLLPDPAQPWLVARVEPAGNAPMSREESDLLAALPHRHTHRGPFAPGEIPSRLLAALQLDASAEGAELLLIEHPAVVADLAGLVTAAADEQRASQEISAELAAWVQPPGSQARDGVPASARPGSPDNDAAFAQAASGDVTAPLRLPQRDFGRPGTERVGGGPPSATVVLATAGDEPVDWLRAGQALHRLLLRAASRWVFASLQSQPLESPQYRAMVVERLSLSGYPQMILEFGRANTALATARRPQAELMTNDQPG
jgi:nitroreductase